MYTNYHYKDMRTYMENMLPAMRRIKKDLKYVKENPPSPGFFAKSMDRLDYSDIECSLWGPEGTPYEGGLFVLHYKINPSYPYERPLVTFETRIYHPNVTFQGDICLDILRTLWHPSYSIWTVMFTLHFLLVEPRVEDFVNLDVHLHCVRDYPGFEEKARRWTKLYAEPWWVVMDRQREERYKIIAENERKEKKKLEEKEEKLKREEEQRNKSLELYHPDGKDPLCLSGIKEALQLTEGEEALRPLQGKDVLNLPEGKETLPPPEGEEALHSTEEKEEEEGACGGNV